MQDSAQWMCCRTDRVQQQHRLTELCANIAARWHLLSTDVSSTSSWLTVVALPLSADTSRCVCELPHEHGGSSVSHWTSQTQSLSDISLTITCTLNVNKSPTQSCITVQSSLLTQTASRQLMHLSVSHMLHIDHHHHHHHHQSPPPLHL